MMRQNKCFTCINKFIVKSINLICSFLLIITPVYASSCSNVSQFRESESTKKTVSLFSWLFGDETALSDFPPFSIEKGHYVYRGGDLLTTYSLDAPLYIEDHMVVRSSIEAESIVINADVEIVSTNDKGQRIQNSGLESKKNFSIKNNGSISMEKGTSITVGADFVSESNRNISLDNGKITVKGDVCIRKKWNSSGNCILKVDGEGKHILKGDKACSVGLLALSETALYNTKVKKYFWQKEPKVFSVEKFSIKLPDSMIIKDYSSEIGKTLHCLSMQSDTPYHIKRFAQNYLYTVLYCNGNMGNVSIDIFDTFFDAKVNGPQVDSVVCTDEKGLYLDAQRKLHAVKVDLSYLGVRNSKDAESVGVGEIIVKDEGRSYRFEFYPRLNEEDDKINEFVKSLRAGASEVIKEQIVDIVIGQAIADLADISAPEVYDLEIGNAICEGNNIYEFLEELDSFTKKWNKMKKGLSLEPDTKTQIQAKEEHQKAGIETPGYGSTDTSEDGTDSRESKCTTYIDVINTLSSEYGSLRIVQNNGDWENEANGLCYLNLIDFTGDGEDELFVVCKKEEEEHYTGCIYTIQNGSIEQLYENPEIEYNFFQGLDLVNLGYTSDTGYVFGTGWEDADADDMTFFWYKDGSFEPVYRYNGYWDGDLEDEIINEEAIIVDIFDDVHRDEFYNSFPSITLRTMGDTDANGDYYDSHELRESIDDVIRRLDAAPSEISPELILPGMDAIADAEIYFCWENEIDHWEPSIENNYNFWSVIGNYGNSESRIDDLDPVVTGDIGDAFILDKRIIENAAYAGFPDFSGSLPEFESYPDMWLVREVGEETVTLGYGAPGVMVERKSFEVNEDLSLDVIYTASYFQDEIEPVADYSVHMELNPNYKKCNDYFTYGYTITGIKKTKNYTAQGVNANDIPDNAVDNMIPLVNAQVNFFRNKSGAEKHVTTCKNEHDFWNTLGAYVNSNSFPENYSSSVYSRDGAVVITRSGVIEMGYALFEDFDGIIPDTDFYEYGPISYDEDEDAYQFFPASMHDYIYKEKGEPVYNDDGTITITCLYEECFWGDREGPDTYVYEITFSINNHVNESSDNPYYYTIISVEEVSILKYEYDKKNNNVYNQVIPHLHGLWYSCTMSADGPISKMFCEGDNFDGEIYEIVEYHDGYLVRIVDGYSYYFGKSLDSCIFVDGWETTENNTSGASGWWKPSEEQRKQYGD